jgi:hypothetical protein
VPGVLLEKRILSSYLAGALVSVKRGLQIDIQRSDQLHKEPESSLTENLSLKLTSSLDAMVVAGTKSVF